MTTTVVRQAARVAALAEELHDGAGRLAVALDRVDQVERRAATVRAEALTELREALAATLAELADPTPAVPAPDWTAALCAQSDPEAFFPENGGSGRPAKRVCRRCPIRTECLSWALATDERFGVWGGLSDRERLALKCRPASSDSPAAESTGRTESTDAPISVMIASEDRGIACSRTSLRESSGNARAA